MDGANFNYTVWSHYGLNSESDRNERLAILEEYIEMYNTIPTESLKFITILLFVIGILANLLLIVYLLASGRFMTPLFTLVTSLALADLGTCFSAILWLVFLFPTIEIPGTTFMCPLTLYFICIFYMASVCHLLLFACMRFAQLIYPLWARGKITWQSVLKACAVIWFVNMMANIFFVVTYDGHHVEILNQTVVFCEYNEKPYDEATKNKLCDILAFGLPAVLIPTVHIVKQCILQKNAKKSLTVQENRRLNSNPRALSIVILLYYISIIPHILYDNVFAMFNVPRPYIHHLLFVAFQISSYLNSIANPFVYCIAAQSVRKDIMNYIRCKSVKSLNS